jgi:hypothetical protein
MKRRKRRATSRERREGNLVRGEWVAEEELYSSGNGPGAGEAGVVY